MSWLKEYPLTDYQKSNRIPNAFMLFVKDQKKDVINKCPVQNKAVIGSFLGKKWRSMGWKEKQVYYDKYHALRRARKNKKRSNSAKNLDITLDDVTFHHENTPQQKEDTGHFCDVKGTVSGSDQGNAEATETEKVNAEPENTTDIYGNSSDLILKPKSKKVCRPPNAFMLYAREQRKTLINSQDRQIHMSTILGHMWRDLPNSEKEKYFSEARKLEELHKKIYPGYSYNPGEARKKKTLRINLKKKPTKKTATKKGKNEVKGNKSKKAVKTSAVSSQDKNNIFISELKEEEIPPATETESRITEAPGNGEAAVNNAPPGETSTVSIQQDEANHQKTSHMNLSSTFQPVTSIDGCHSSFCHCNHSSWSQWPMDRYNDFLHHHSHDRGFNRSCYGNVLSQPHPNLADSRYWMYQSAFRSFSQYPCHFPMPVSNPYCHCQLPCRPFLSPYVNTYYSEGYRSSLPSVPMPDIHPAPLSSSTATSSRNDDPVAVPADNNDDDENNASSSSKSSVLVVDEENDERSDADTGLW